MGSPVVGRWDGSVTMVGMVQGMVVRSVCGRDTPGVLGRDSSVNGCQVQRTVETVSTNGWDGSGHGRDGQFTVGKVSEWLG